MFQLMIDPMTGQPGPIIRRVSDGASIPPDPQNTDYVAYLEWVAEGNTAEEWTPQP